MASARQVSVTSTATLLDVNTTGQARSVLVRNRGAVAVYLGGPDVATNTGFQLDPDESTTVSGADGIGNSSGLYGRTASSSATVHVLQVG